MPRDPRAYLQRAEEHRRHGRLKEAIALSIEALGRHPGLDAVRVTLGRAYLENAQPEEARTTLLEVFGRLPEHHLAGKLLIESQRLLGDLDGAASTCRTLLEHYPRDREIEPLLAEIVKAQSHPQAPGAASPAPARPPAPAVAASPISGPAPGPKTVASAVPRIAVTPSAAVIPEPPAEEADPEPDYLPEDIGPMRAVPPPIPPMPVPPMQSTRAPIAAVAMSVPMVAPPPAPVAATTASPARSPEVAAPVGNVSRIPEMPAPVPGARFPEISAPAPAVRTPEIPIPAVARVPETPVSAPAMKSPSTPNPPATIHAAAPPPAAAAPAPVVPVAATAAASAPKRDALETNTLAELYVKQGLPDRAIEVYRSMLRVEPGNAAARRRLAELEAAAGVPAPSAKGAPATAAIPVAPASAVSAAAPARTPGAVAAAPAPSPLPKAPAAPARAAASPAPEVRDAADQAAIERLTLWLDTMKRGQKSLDDGAAA